MSCPRVSNRLLLLKGTEVSTPCVTTAQPYPRHSALLNEVLRLGSQRSQFHFLPPSLPHHQIIFGRRVFKNATRLFSRKTKSSVECRKNATALSFHEQSRAWLTYQQSRKRSAERSPLDQVLGGRGRAALLQFHHLNSAHALTYFEHAEA